MISYAKLICALIAIESGGDPGALNKGEDARGCLQIRACVIKDVNRIYGTRFAHNDAYKPAKAKAICLLYLLHYCKPGQRTYERMSRTFNGGPNGYRKQSTLKYWQKVKRELNK